MPVTRAGKVADVGRFGEITGRSWSGVGAVMEGETDTGPLGRMMAFDWTTTLIPSTV